MHLLKPSSLVIQLSLGDKTIYFFSIFLGIVYTAYLSLAFGVCWLYYKIHIQKKEDSVTDLIKKTIANGFVIFIFFGNLIAFDVFFFPLNYLNSESENLFDNFSGIWVIRSINLISMVLVWLYFELYSTFCRSFIKSKKNSLVVGELSYLKIQAVY